MIDTKNTKKSTISASAHGVAGANTRARFLSGGVDGCGLGRTTCPAKGGDDVIMGGGGGEGLPGGGVERGGEGVRGARMVAAGDNTVPGGGVERGGEGVRGASMVGAGDPVDSDPINSVNGDGDLGASSRGLEDTARSTSGLGLRGSISSESTSQTK